MFSIIEVQKGICLSSVLKSRESIQLDAVNGPENALFDVRIGLFQLPQQQLHLLALALPYAVL